MTRRQITYMLMFALGVASLLQAPIVDSERSEVMQRDNTRNQQQLTDIIKLHSNIVEGGGIAVSDMTIALLDRPLFAQGRRALDTPPANTITREDEIPSLVGVLITDGLPLALFKQATGATVTVSLGQYFAGYVVKAISLDTVILTGKGGARVLTILKGKDVLSNVRPSDGRRSTFPAQNGARVITPLSASEPSEALNRRWIKGRQP